MGRYIVRRLLLALPALLVVSTVTVGLRELISDERLLGGDVFGDEEMAELRTMLGIGQSFSQRYVEWVGGALRGDFGTSWWTERGVMDEIGARSRVSVGLMLIALMVALTIAMAHGVGAAMRPGGRLDRWSASILRIGAATPEFIITIMGAYTLYALMGWTPADHTRWGAPESPIAALVVGGFAAGWYTGARTAIGARSAQGDEPDHHYVLAARAKGLSDTAIATKHVLRNAAVSALRAAVGTFPLLLGSVLMVEVALGLPGVGYLALQRALIVDYPVMGAVLFLTAVTVIGVNLVVDIACAALDPRIRYT